MSTEPDKPKNGPIAILVVLTCMTIIAVIIGVNVYFDGIIHKEVGKKVSGAGLTDLSKLHGDEAAHLGGYSWVDEKKGVVRIPLERAKQLVLEDYSKPIAVAPKPAPAAPTDGAPKK